MLGEIEVSWVTDPVTKENLQLALMQDIGVNGDVSFAATGGALAPQVPIAIQIADRDSFGRGAGAGPKAIATSRRIRSGCAICTR